MCSFLTKRHISRRTVLKGMGVTVALPVLDAMVPARTAFAKTAAAPRRPSSVWSAMEMVHGCAGSTAIGAKKNLWAPAAGRPRLRPGARAASSRSSPSATTSPSSATPTCDRPRRSRCRKSAATTSARSAVFLTQSHPKQTAGHRRPRRHVARSDLRAAVRPGHADSVDAAVDRERRPGRRLHLRLLVRLHRHDQLGVAEAAAADGARPARRVRPAVRRRRDRRGARRVNRRTDRSILDWVTRQVDAAAQASSAPSDRRGSNDYLENIREIERRIQQRRGAQRQRRAARAARRADRRARLVRGARAS